MRKRLLVIAAVLVAFVCGLSLNLRRTNAQGNGAVRIYRGDELQKLTGHVVGFACQSEFASAHGCYVLIQEP